MIFCARATRGLRKMRGSGQVPFLLAERAHSESARSMRAVKGILDRSLQERRKEFGRPSPGPLARLGVPVDGRVRK